MIPFGDRAVRFAVSGSPLERRALSDALRALPGVVDVVVAEEHALVVYEGERPAIDAVAPKPADITVAEHVIETLYDGEDLEELTKLTGVDVVRVHSDARYEVSFIGFMPGFAYLRGLPESLVVPRRANPRARVPRGSVAIAARYAGVYPSDSPGGWHLLGRTVRTPAWQIGDRVRFERVDSIETPRNEAGTPLVLGDAEVRSVQGFAHVVGAPEKGRMHEGIPHRGPLVMEAFARLGTRTAIEVFGSITIGDLVVSSGRDARVAYVGLAVDAPIGTRIVRGDRLATTGVALPSPVVETPISIAIMRGPDFVPLDGTFRIASTSNRVGTRLEGPPVPFAQIADAPSTPMVKGAIEITPAGLVVLGPDHPTTGGYPVAGILREFAMDAFYKLPIGASVRFTTE
jgi:KipI family sensor histidine kinase inhibitor